jgi:hypothetical protein
MSQIVPFRRGHGNLVESESFPIRGLAAKERKERKELQNTDRLGGLRGSVFVFFAFFRG